ncbi:pyruvate kinase [Pelagicoccus sp. SDUM812002]|uniref:pyruvate kinase n=1 Tax=Pelagicoccus sp. SDUM812002 TaxID=3041266 RepID=UPI00280DD605|nr:pyruvate kinase [Pelagicoccus sp. SDUM812002]MDQ8187821.1 pyruvate kinase [Pelagicoccus sp. SDUM812002]
MYQDSHRIPRRTKIIFTIGPATDSEEMLESLIGEHYVDICRINMAHADHDYVRKVVRRVRKVGERLNRHIPIMMDVKGPEVRTGDLEAPIELREGETFDFTIKPGGEDARGSSGEEIRSVDVNYAELINDVEVGSIVLVDNGLIRLEVLEKINNRIRCKVLIPGELTSRRHINLPGVKVNLPALTEKDRNDTRVGIEEGVDFYALSFVRESSDLQLLRDFLDTNGAHRSLIIAKIEDQSAISNLHSIVQDCDGLMVARGDLGIECPFETLPTIQRKAVKACLTLGKPVIIATHMLESMISSPMPTRAEVSDVANAVLEEADCVMLSGETTIGQYPEECVDAITKISTEVDRNGEKTRFAKHFSLNSDKAKIQHSAVVMANELNAVAIICFTRSGNMAKGVSALRPERSPIFAFSNSHDTIKQLRMHHGVIPFEMIFCTEPDATVSRAMKHLKKMGYLIPGDKIVVVSDILASDSVIDSIQLRTVSAD